jgi:two-component system, OmpR family, sensor kinase
MDGRPGGASRSLTRQLTLSIIVIIALLGLLGAGLSFMGNYREASRLQDSHLHSLGLLINSGKLVLAAPTVTLPDAREAGLSLIITRVSPGKAGAVPDAPLPKIDSLSDGFQNVYIHDRRWRVDVQALQDGDRLVVAEPSTIRDEIAREGSLRTLVPMLAMTPLLLIAIVLIARRALLPVRRLAATVDGQDELTLHSLSELGIPQELLPFIRSINRLISRLKEAMAQQRRFIADAAHELRTPLAALTLQAENLAAASDPEDARKRLQTLQAAVRRNTRLVEQLLALARSQHAEVPVRNFVSLHKLATEAIQDAVNVANAKGVDLGLKQVDDVKLDLDVSAITIALRNLVDNAVRYVPEGGRVDITLVQQGDQLVCDVRDSGPGVPEDELVRITERFYRVPGTVSNGSGLGLSIVSEIARRNGGSLVLKNASDGFHATYFHLL